MNDNDNTPNPDEVRLPDYSQSGYYSSQPGYTETQPTDALPYGAPPTPPAGSQYAPSPAYGAAMPGAPQGPNGGSRRRGAGGGWGWRRWLLIGAAVVVALALLGAAAWVVDVAQGAGTPVTQATATPAPTATAAPKHDAPIYTVGTVSGNTITATGADGTTITIDVTPTTKITLLDHPATLSEITNETKIRVMGKMQGNTITARHIAIVPPAIAGQITAISGMTITVQTKKHGAVTITITPTTIYRQGQSFSTLHVGDEVTVAISKNSDGTYSALGIADHTAAMALPTPTPSA